MSSIRRHHSRLPNPNYYDVNAENRATNKQLHSFRIAHKSADLGAHLQRCRVSIVIGFSSGMHAQLLLHLVVTRCLAGHMQVVHKIFPLIFRAASLNQWSFMNYYMLWVLLMNKHDPIEINQSSYCGRIFKVVRNTTFKPMPHPLLAHSTRPMILVELSIAKTNLIDLVV